MNQDQIKVTASGAAAVDQQYHWREIDDKTPRGAKIQLISKRYGVAQYGTIGTNVNFFTHWAPLPKFKELP